MLRPEDHIRAIEGEQGLLGSVGRVQMGIEMQLRGRADEVVSAGDVGQVVVRGPAVMVGYASGAAEPASRTGSTATASDGWHHTGDLGHLAAEGYLTLVDRLGDVVISGGYNLYPREVELVLEAFPEVAQVAVFGVPDDEWGEQLCAAIVVRPGSAVADSDLITRCRARLAGYKIPRRFIRLEELPMNSSGKVLKRELRAGYEAMAPADATEGKS
jgi:acyl-CoA synthetase (AMP-forming)/AMP-acid ligase II